MNTFSHSLKKRLTLSSPTQVKQKIVREIIQPENQLEQAIVQNPTWLEGAFWGEPRTGHPEGKIIYHIREVLANVHQLNCSKKIRRQLRLIALIHDTFKFQEEQIRPRKDWSKHHAIYALKFARNYLVEQEVLDAIELHDEAYYAWGMVYYHRNILGGLHRLDTVKRRMRKHLQLYYLFFKCDTQTGDKTQQPVHWFEQKVKDIELVVI